MILKMNEDGDFDLSGMRTDSDRIRKKPHMRDDFYGTVREYRATADNIIDPHATCSECDRVLAEQEGYYCDTTVTRASPTTFRYLCIQHGEEGNTGDLFAPPTDAEQDGPVQFRQLAAA